MPAIPFLYNIAFDQSQIDVGIKPGSKIDAVSRVQSTCS